MTLICRVWKIPIFERTNIYISNSYDDVNFSDSIIHRLWKIQKIIDRDDIAKFICMTRDFASLKTIRDCVKWVIPLNNFFILKFDIIYG